MELIKFGYDSEKALQAMLSRYVEEHGALGAAIVVTFPDGTQKRFHTSNNEEGQ